jgi:hypothetical protein
MSAKLKLALAVVLIGAAVTGGILVTRGSATGDMSALSNRGGPTIAIRGLHTKLAPIHAGNVLAVRHGRALYRLHFADGSPCFGVGPAKDLGAPGSVVCPRGDFPGGGNPVLDFSIYEGTRHEFREFSLFRIEGFAADGVAAVEFFRPNGDVALRVPVSSNVYSAATVPQGPIAGFAAVDKGGKRLWRSP